MTNPIIAGFHPDPSICRVGDTYYLATSTFEYLPGVPIHRSTDLVNWELIGNALDRTEQLPPNPGHGLVGIYAPTLRHHDGKFWLTTTDVGNIRNGQIICSADNPAGPWSAPAYVRQAIGIDPDLSWDEDGVCRLTWASALPTRHGIATVEINPATGELLGEPRLLWQGTGMAFAEGPHLYRIDGWWYLLLAEGGTERGHCVTIARARTLDGPFEEAPHNPILTHRSTDHPVQNTGHGDLLQLADGSWVMPYHGVRPQGKTPKFHANGRETFLAGIDWVDGWPRVVKDRFEAPIKDHSFSDDFSAATLAPLWVGPGIDPRNFTRRDDAGHLVIERSADAIFPTAVMTRIRDRSWSAEAALENLRGSARFQLRLDAKHWYGLRVEGDEVQAVLNVGPAISVVGRVPLPASGQVRLRISAAEAPPLRQYVPADEPDLITLTVIEADGAETAFGPFDGRYLSTEVAGGFTGRTVGVEVLDGSVTISAFRYQTIS